MLTHRSPGSWRRVACYQRMSERRLVRCLCNQRHISCIEEKQRGTEDRPRWNAAHESEECAKLDEGRRTNPITKV